MHAARRFFPASSTGCGYRAAQARRAWPLRQGRRARAPPPPPLLLLHNAVGLFAWEGRALYCTNPYFMDCWGMQEGGGHWGRGRVDPARRRRCPEPSHPAAAPVRVNKNPGGLTITPCTAFVRFPGPCMARGSRALVSAAFSGADLVPSAGAMPPEHRTVGFAVTERDGDDGHSNGETSAASPFQSDESQALVVKKAGGVLRDKHGACFGALGLVLVRSRREGDALFPGSKKGGGVSWEGGVGKNDCMHGSPPFPCHPNTPCPPLKATKA